MAEEHSTGPFASKAGGLAELMAQLPLSVAPITLSELESHLWEAANILRGSPVDRSDWKNYILPLLFFKRLCDVWDEEVEEARQLY